MRYHTRAIITRGFYIYCPIFEVYLCFQGGFSENYVLVYGSQLVFKSDFKSRAGYDGVCTVVNNIKVEVVWRPSGKCCHFSKEPPYREDKITCHLDTKQLFLKYN